MRSPGSVIVRAERTVHGLSIHHLRQAQFPSQKHARSVHHDHHCSPAGVAVRRPGPCGRSGLASAAEGSDREQRSQPAVPPAPAGGSVTANADFDARTKSAVISYQQSQGLAADGIVRPATWSRLVVSVAPGSTQANAVRALQFQLRKHGYAIAADGVFGEGTSAAVQDYKTQHRLTGGTTVGPTTWQHLLGSPPGSGAMGTYAFIIPRTAVHDGRESLLWPHHDYPASDIAVETGTPAYAITSGIARLNGGLDESCGLGVAIDGDDGVIYQYCHLDSRSVSDGTRVAAGQLVAHTGNTGNSTGSHLHFGIFRQGVSVCPQQLLIALYDGLTPPSPWTLPASGCSS
ncbi:peptidoglycan DD-metalloendopeptidase family protein [Streptomyces sp. NPDC090093]|uniref:peptidoglycan DD-metalloendopeptidase family protein n=1 Tax=Streptomyces sp. NPDC090093 TaxID=3365945 RepID=UPI00381AC9D9